MDKKDRLKIIQLVWVDPHSIDEWSDVDELGLENMVQIVSVGILLKEDKHRYVVALNLDAANSNASCTMIIPKFAVSHVEVLGYVKEIDS